MPIVLDKEGLIDRITSKPGSKVGEEICPSHISRVWDAINILLKRILCSGQGTRIPGFFSITFNVIEVVTPTGEGNIILQRSPYMFLANELVTKHSLRAKQPRYRFDESDADLSMEYVAKICHMEKGLVELCLSEIIEAFDEALAEDEQVELWLNKIGRILVDSKVVYVGYCPTFLTLLGYSEGVKRTFVTNMERFSGDYEESRTSRSSYHNQDDMEGNSRHTSLRSSMKEDEEEEREMKEEEEKVLEEEYDDMEEDDEFSGSHEDSTRPKETPPSSAGRYSNGSQLTTGSEHDSGEDVPIIETIEEVLATANSRATLRTSDGTQGTSAQSGRKSSNKSEEGKYDNNKKSLELPEAPPPPLQQIYESEWGEYEKQQEESVEELDLFLDEEEVVEKLKIKKKCKVTKHEFFLKDKTAPLPKKIQASHVLVPKRNFEKKHPIVKPKPVVIVKKDAHHLQRPATKNKKPPHVSPPTTTTTQTSAPTSSTPKSPIPVGFNPEKPRCTVAKEVPSVIFKSASDLICCSRAASLIQYANERKWAEPCFTATVIRAPSRVGASCRSRSRKCELCPPRGLKSLKQQAQEKGDDNDCCRPITATPSPSKTDFCCYPNPTTFCPSQRKQAQICYMRECQPLDLFCCSDDDDWLEPTQKLN